MSVQIEGNPGNKIARRALDMETVRCIELRAKSHRATTFFDMSYTESGPRDAEEELSRLACTS